MKDKVKIQDKKGKESVFRVGGFLNQKALGIGFAATVVKWQLRSLLRAS